MELFDAHLHWWDTQARPNPVVVAAPLPAVYTPSDYITHTGRSFSTVFPDARVVGGVCVESVVSCHLASENGEAPLSSRAEARAMAAWCRALASRSDPLDFVAVPFVNLTTTDPGALVEELEHHQRCLGKRFVGVRTILNFDAKDPSRCWPGVQRDYLALDDEGNANSLMVANLGSLIAANIAFDLQCNPAQLYGACALTKALPALRVCLNHIGCPRLRPVGRSREDNDYNEREFETWESGIRALAEANRRTHVKLSMLDYAVNGWTTREAVADGRRGQVERFVEAIVDAFGEDRCMVGSNFPVEQVGAVAHWEAMRGVLSKLGVGDAVWARNAQRFYCGTS